MLDKEEEGSYRGVLTVPEGDDDAAQSLRERGFSNNPQFLVIFSFVGFHCEDEY